MRSFHGEKRKRYAVFLLAALLMLAVFRTDTGRWVSAAEPAAQDSGATVDTAAAAEHATGTDAFEEAQTLRVGYFAFDGYHEMDADGNMSGYGYELLQLIARYENISYEYVGYDKNWQEMQEMLVDGEIDFVTSASKSAEREERFDFSERAIGTSSTMLTVKAGNRAFTAGDFSSYDGMKVGMLPANSRNDSFADYAEEHGFTYSEKYYDTNTELREALQAGEVDAIVTSSFRTTDEEWVLDTFDEKSVYIITRKGDTETMELIDDALEKLDRYEPGWRLSLNEKYYSISSGENINLSVEEEEYLRSLKDDGKTVHVAVNPDRYPYSFVGEDGKLTGIMLDEFAVIAERLGLEYEVFQVTTRQEYVDLLKTGDVEICLDMHEDFSNAEKYGYKITDIYIDAPFSWVLLKDFTGEPKVVSTVGASAAKTTTLDSDMYSDIEYVYYDSFDECLEGLRKGEVDGYYTYTYNAEKIVFDNTHNDLKTRLSNGEAHFCIGVKQDMDVCLLDALNKGVASLSDNEKDRITEKYVNLGSQEFSLVRLAYQYPLVIVFLVICIVLTVICIALTARAHFYQRQTDAALVKAEKADAAKTTFLSNMSHDIRTPINGIMGMLEIAKNNIQNTEKVSECLTKMQKAAGHLLSLINDVLDMSKIESGVVDAEEEAFDIRTLMDACCSIFEGQNEKKNLKLVREIGTFAHPYLYGSELYIRRIVINILGNAYKYTPDGGTITLSAQETGYADGKVSLCIAVRDTGIGMDEEFLKTIFEPFTQEQIGSRSDYSGTGLGMAISKQLAEQMHGTLEAESTRGEGSIFTLKLTLPETEKPEVTHPTKDTGDIAGIRILLAEDNDLNREIAVSLLQEAEAIVTTVKNGKEAVNLYSASKPGQFDVILMDVMMPEMDGLEATREIRRFEESEKRKQIPIIAMTANVFEDDIKACLHAGMNGHVGKPIDTRKLTAKIVKLVRSETAEDKEQR